MNTMETKICSTCYKEKDINYFYNRENNTLMSMCKECFNAYCVKRWIDRKIKYINLFGGKCKKCGLPLDKTHYSVFEFHHRDSNTKEYSWTKLRLFSDKKIIQELNKCDLLCANCHRITHAELR